MRVWFLLLALTGCWRLDCEDPRRIPPPEGPVQSREPEQPLRGLELRRALGHLESGGSFLFSTNRKSGGGTFDVHPTAVRFDNECGFAADTAASSWAVRGIADRINTPGDELGPAFVFQSPADEDRKEPAALVFSRGRGGNHDLVALSPEAPPAVIAGLSAFQDSLVEVRLDPLNTSADEGYATWSRETGTIYFHSDRDGRYALYQAVIPERAGGQGGFDIYRSRRDGSAWSAP